MDMLINVFINVLLYVSIPFAIRYAILRRPIENKWIAIGILVPVFIGFSILINVQREESQRKIYQQLNIPYTPRPHMIGSPILYGSLVASYFILRRGRKKTAATDSNSSTALIDKASNRPTVCPNCKAAVSTDSVYCHKCGNNITAAKKVVS